MPISIRIVHLDHYLAKPGPLDRAFSPFSDRKLTKVPVLRIFGSTKAGQNVCLHVHQIFPYFFVPYTIPAECTTEKDIQKDIFQFGTSLNEAMNLARPNAEKDQHIAAIVLTKGIPFYGYHVGYQAYLKIYMTNSYEKQHMLDILQTSAIGNTSYQPHEAHLNFELQFLMDHNLYGMDWIHIDENHGLDSSSASFGIRFRLPLLDEPKSSYHISQSSSSYNSHSTISSKSPDPVLPVYTSKTVPAQLQSGTIPRESYCELEMDITAMSILNRHGLQERNIHTSLKKEKDIQATALGSEEEKVEKLVKSLDSIWKDEANRRRSRGIKEPIPPVSQVDERNPRVPWSAEPDLRRSIEKMMTHKPFNEDSETQDPSILMPGVMTVFQAVEALYPEEYFVYTREKEQQQQQEEEELKLSINQTSQEKEKEPKMLVSSPPETSSFSPILPSSGTPISNQFNVSATPSRYRVWNLSSQLDKSVIHTAMESASFCQDQEEPYHDDIVSENKDDNYDEHTKEKEEDDNEDGDSFNLENSLRNSDLVRWLENSERDATAVAQRHPTQIIEYEPHESTYKPRKLDFIAESKKMEAILQTQSKKLKKDILNFSEETDEESDCKQQPFRISDVPPESMPHVLKSLQRAKRIDQLDGTNDQLGKDTKKRQKSAEERWEQEKKTLKRLRMKKSAAKQLEREHRTLSAPPTTNTDVIESVDLRRVKSSTSLNPEEMKGAQRVTVRIPRYIPNKRKSNTNGSNTAKRKELPLDPPKLVIEPRSLDNLCLSSSQPATTADSESINTIPNMNEIDNETYRLREFEDLAKETLRSSSLEKQSDDGIPHSFPIAVSLQTSVENIPQTSSIPTSISKTQIIDQIDTKDQLQASSLSQIESFNANSSEEKASASDINSQTSRLYEHESSNDQPLVSKLGAAAEHASNDSYPSWVYDPADFEDTQSPIKSAHHHHTNSSDASLPRILIYNHVPPVVLEEDLPKEAVVYQEPYYSKPSDLPRYPTVFFGKEFKLPTSGLTYLKKFKSSFDIQTPNTNLKSKTRIRVWTPTEAPPSLTDVKEWLHNKESRKAPNPLRETPTQLSEPTALNTFNFKYSASKPRAKVKCVRDYIEYFSLEIHVNTREHLLPDPEHDAIQLIFWCLQTEDCRIPSNGYQEGYFVGVIAIEEFDISKIGLNRNQINIDYAQSEEQLFSILIEKIRYYDPDMLVGYEIQNASWGYIVDRGVQLGFHMLDELSRVIVTSETIKRDQWGYQKASVYRVIGRHMLNVWRMMKSELTLTSYTFENVAYNLLHDRVPHYSCATLTSWYQKGPSILKYRLFKYYMKRVQVNLDMLDASQVVSRTCESARVYGIDFYAVISRGSQYNVESVMFRIAKPENYVLVTPNRQQVASQRSLEIVPLIMEPISQFYSNPMVVLDFQSLYPSIMIAYNYCYSTCLGRVRKPRESSRFGVLSSFELDDGQLDALKDHINVSPNGVMFVKPEIRKSLLAKMLTELLDTRVMIKRAMKDYKEDSGLLRILDAKQLTLKLLANVTYGYTSASFSGRMPSVEIADSIVSTGRETLERAIRLINDTEQWGARVVYGDTDSLFIYFPGKTKDEAFTLANEIAETVTKMNPSPVKLKFEKVYHPAVLLAKKRYVGFKYENRNEIEPVFEAKGIETVRRDGTPATRKILESCLKILFRTQDMSELKEFLYRQWTRILSNRVLLQDFVIAKEVRMGTYSSRGGPNGAQVAQAQMNADARAEPQYGERVPYVVIYRGPNARLKDKVVRPETLLGDSSLRLDAEYYIRKQIIPPLSRIFNLMGVDILSWYESMPRSQKITAMNLAQNTGHQAKNLTRIDQYYASSHCILCRKLSDHSLCEQCRQNPGQTIFNLISRQQLTRQRFRKILQMCQDCSTLSPLDAMSVVSNTELMADIPCDSLDCPVFYERLKAKQDVNVTSSYNSLIDGLSDSSLQH